MGDENNQNNENDTKKNFISRKMEEIKNAITKGIKLSDIKKWIKNLIGKLNLEALIPLIFLGIILIIIFVCAAYIEKMIDGKEDSSSSSNVPSAVSSYTSTVTVGSSGELTTSSSIQELWDDLVENDSPIAEYLDSAEELAWLVNAELITQNVDTRSDPDEEIDWDEVISEMTAETDDDDDDDDDYTITNIQGIIKFKRVTEDDTEGTTMTYVDYTTFYEWIEEYNTSGSEEAKENLLTHFTLEETESTETTTTNETEEATYTTIDYSESQWTNISEAIVAAALVTPTTPSGYCMAWVNNVYNNAGFGSMSGEGAYQAYQDYCISTSTDNIPIGAVVWGTGSDWTYKGSVNLYGHVGIYIGDYDGDGEGDVIDSTGTVNIQSLSDWIAWQVAEANPGLDEEPGWLGWGWGNIGDTEIELITDEEEIEEIEARLNTASATGDVSITSNGTTVTSGTYYAVVATWNSTIVTVDTNDSERDEDVEADETEYYSVSTKKIDYQSLTSGYTMPFNYLWEFLVITENKDFVLELAQLVYESEIEISVYDKETVNVEVETTNYNIERWTETSVDELTYKYLYWYRGKEEVRNSEGELTGWVLSDDVKIYVDSAGNERRRRGL